MKVMVLGCTHAGTAAILTARRLFPEAQITTYERNDNISFLSCGIALYVGGVVKDPNDLFYCSPEKLQELSVKTCMNHDVLKVDLATKTAKIKDLTTGQEINDTFDKLIITTGSWPIKPPIPGVDLKNILFSKNFNHSETIINSSKNAKKIVVIGAGYIGVELAEAFRENGKEVVLIDAESRMMSRYMDAEFTCKAEQGFKEHGIKLALGEKVTSFQGINGQVNRVITDKGSYEADLVILSVGFKPNTDLFKDQIAMLPNGAIQTDEFMRTSHPDVLAAGDCCATLYNPTSDLGPKFWVPFRDGNAAFYGPSKEYSYVPLATNAVRMGTLAGLNLVEEKMAYPGTQGTSGIKIYEHNMAATGVTEEEAKRRNLDVDSILIEDNCRPEFMPIYEKVLLKVVYEVKTKRIIGAQIHSTTDLTQAINTLSVCIQNRMLISDLAFVDFFFQPHFNKPWSFINLAGLESMKK